MDVGSTLGELTLVLNQIKRRQRDRVLQARAARRDAPRLVPRGSHNAVLKALAIEKGELAPGVEYWLVDNPMTAEWMRMQDREAAGLLPKGFCESLPILQRMVAGFNGYVAFPKRNAPLKARELTGLIEAIPVHGGVTYVCKDKTAAVYGFDTCHHNSEHVPRYDRTWMKWQCQVLYEGLLMARKIEDRYLKAGLSERAELLQPLVDLVPEQEIGTGLLLRAWGRNL